MKSRMLSFILWTLILLLLFLALSSCASTGSTPMTVAKDAGWSQFGDSSISGGGGEVVALGALSGGEKNVIVEGTILEVCSVKGCWMRVQQDGQELFVRFKDYGFFVPKDASGKRVVMHGVSEKKMASVEELRHYAEDAGKSEAEIAMITEPQERITFYADSVYIEGEWPGWKPPGGDDDH